MAWGFFNKIKSGLKKAFNFGRKALGAVNDKIIKPFSPAITAAATAFNPALGAAVGTGLSAFDKVNSFANSSKALSWGKDIG